jgi:hypothetical protein
MISLLGACLLSAAAYVPAHILPVLVVVVTGEGRASIAQAGWIGSAYMAGQLVVAIGLPALRCGPLTRTHAFFIGIFLLMGVLLSAHGAELALVAAWFFIGLASGALYYLGTLFAARFQDVAVAFSTRLSVSLLVGGTTLIVVQLVTGSAAYAQLVYGLAAALAVVLAVGLGCYRQPAATPFAQTPSVSALSDGRLVLSILYLLFVGQIGYWTFALKSTAQLAMPTEHALGAIAGCKILAAFIMWPLSYRERTQSISSGFLLPGSILAAGILIAVNAGSPLVFVMGLLAWEVGFNVLSARLQIKAVQINPLYSGSWITAVIFLGAATGPAAQGHAMAHGLQAAFIAFAVVSALLPAVWEWLMRWAASSSVSAQQAAGQYDKE